MNEFNLKELLNKQVILTGMARNAKGGAILLLNEMPIYLKGLLSWSPEYFGKMVKLKGILREEKMIPDPYTDHNGGISQGALGMQFVLEDAELLE